MRSSYDYLDPLYGPTHLEDPVALLVGEPVIQRLRWIRLSNIDSLDLPGVANVSRFEHVLGVCRLASSVGFASRLSSRERVILGAACLLHDAAITPFGHLVEEALQYTGVPFEHEAKWAVLLAGGDDDLGGVNPQILNGREAGLKSWASKALPEDPTGGLKDVLDAVRGRGLLGPVVCGALDLDNIDNVIRAGFHMGLPVDTSLPLRLAASMRLDEVAHVVFSEAAIPDIKRWLETRAAVYDRFMLSERDFVGKIMLLFATVQALGLGILGPRDWTLTDAGFLQRLRGCGDDDVSEAVKRWELGDLWKLAPLSWFAGDRPQFEKIRVYSLHISEHLGRRCFAYAIGDKRRRLVRLSLDSGGPVDLGERPLGWVLGVASENRRDFTRAEREVLAEIAREAFPGCTPAPLVRNDDGHRQLFPRD